MKGILIGDIGSTRAEWAWIAGDQKETFETPGFNPVLHKAELLNEMLSRVKDNCPGEVQRIHYYGTGIISDFTREEVISKWRLVFGDIRMTCESDMLGAALALSPEKEGIICILGTGSNSCLFDGKSITKQIPSLGFPLGDEGSGADIGKACVRAFYYGLMPESIRTAFQQILPDDRARFLMQYREHPAPNRLLAGLAPTMTKHLDSPFVHDLLADRFRTFARLHVAPYQASCPVHFAGSIAFGFREILEDTIRKEHLIPGKIVKSPIAGLVEYHQNNQV